MLIIPWGLIALFIAYYLFYTINKKRTYSKEERREKLKRTRQKYLDINRK